MARELAATGRISALARKAAPGRPVRVPMPTYDFTAPRPQPGPWVGMAVKTDLETGTRGT
jgi:hypothetical protein